VSLSAGLEQLSGAACGGVARETLHLGVPEDVAAEAQDAIAQTGGRRLVLSVGCVAMTNTPLRNIRALREAADG
jgi:uroporphyrinogen decarboxylase